jgi:hypothetical protein
MLLAANFMAIESCREGLGPAPGRRPGFLRDAAKLANLQLFASCRRLRHLNDGVRVFVREDVDPNPSALVQCCQENGQ